jgi:uncharacterized protein (DUF2461 family)
LSAAGLAAGRGTYMMAPDQLKRYRDAVDEEGPGERLREIVAAADRHGIEITGHEQLKSAPRGYAKDHPRADLLRYKGLIAWRQWPVEPWLGTAKAKPRVVQFLHLCDPLTEWLNAHVGPSVGDHRT